MKAYIEKATRQLEKSGYKVYITWSVEKCRASWLDRVKSPEGDVGLILRQSPNQWHFFAQDYVGIASGHSPEQAQKGGLWDIIDTEQSLKTYCQYVLYKSADKFSREYKGFAAAQAAIDTQKLQEK